MIPIGLKDMRFGDIIDSEAPRTTLTETDKDVIAAALLAAVISSDTLKDSKTVSRMFLREITWNEPTLPLFLKLFGKKGIPIIEGRATSRGEDLEEFRKAYTTKADEFAAAYF